MVYIEREAFAAACLVARMEEAKLASAPIWDDVCTFDARPWRGLVDLVAGGTPCQDLSLAGKRAGLDGERSRLFFEHVRITVECEAPFFFWENVAGATQTMDDVCAYLAERSYSGVWTIVRASDIGAPHERARIFLLAYSDRFMSHGPWGREGRWSEPPDARSALANGHGHGRASERSSGLQHGEREAFRDDADGRSRTPAQLADSYGIRRQGDRTQPSERRVASKNRSGLPNFPPGPDDRDAWSRILAARPDLAPALENPNTRRGGGVRAQADMHPAQSRLRGVADGLAGGLDASLRADRLRACGNGVHPEQAAHAWRGLWQHLFPMKEQNR